MAGTNNGTLLSSATFGSGEVGSAFSLDGTNDVIEVPSSPALSFGANAAMTLELWAYRTTENVTAHILGKRVGCTAMDINYEICWDAVYGLQFNSGTGVGALTGIQLPMRTWTHLAGTFEAGTYKFYINGQLVATSTGQPLGPTNSAPLKIGGAGDCALFGGLLDEVSIYNRALSASEIAAIYTAGSAGKCVPPPNCIPPPSGLVGWWPGEGSANDIAGTNNGTLSGGVTFAGGEVGQAFSFDGINDSVIIPDSSSLRLTTHFTIEAWINAAHTVGPQGIVSKVGGPAGNYGYQLSTYYDNTLYGIINSPGEGWPSATIRNATPIVLGTWNHVAFTYDQSAMMLYLNGLPVATNIIGPKTIATTSSNLRISGDDNSHGYFDGLIDEVSIYNRALSPSEIAAIYDASSAGKCMNPFIRAQPQSQVGYWGKSVTLTVTAAGTAPLGYQWQKDGVPITGATGASLVLTNLQMTDAGGYTVVVTNLYGVATSAPAYLTMNPAGVSLALYAGITIDGVVGLTYGIQYSTNLSNTNGWRGMANVTLSVPTELWFDVQPASKPQRYYRVVPGPITIP